MKRIFIPTKSAADWAPLLAKPKLHWKKGRSAMSLAACWESAHPNMPVEVIRCFETASDPLLSALSLVLALPEFTTPLPGGATSTQTDIMVLARNHRGLVAIGVEGKVEEEFGPTIEQKRLDSSEGQSARLDYLHEQLCITHPLSGSLRYQLLHRTVAAVLFAIETHASAAVMLVHSFSIHSTWFEDFSAFSTALGAAPLKDGVSRSATSTAIPLFLGWVSGDRVFTEVDAPARF